MIDPSGLIRDPMTGRPLDGVKCSLYWADTRLNRNNGRMPGTLVQLPELPEFKPNKNHNPQTSKDSGRYGWMVFPDGDYYIIAEKDGYEIYDSRSDPLDEQYGKTSYVKNGIIHVGQTMVVINVDMRAKVVDVEEHRAYIQGYPDGTFRPENNITRAELAAILTRVVSGGRVIPGEPHTCNGVPASHWAARQITTAIAQKWMVGYPDGSFRPEGLVTRAEMAAVFYRIKTLPPGQGTAFNDIAGHWALGVIESAEKNGLIKGYSDGTFRPDQPVTRAEAVVMINRLLGRKPLWIQRTPLWPDVRQGYWGYPDIMEASLDYKNEKFSNGMEKKETGD
ncbi:MAG: S-layer homology domain-containing protein [Bacillota bacterium]